MNVRRRRETLQLVPLAPEYLDTVLRVEAETFGSPWSRAAFVREIVEPRSHFFVLLRNGAVVGYGGYWEVADEMHISNIAIDAPLRGRGYGRWLLCALLRDAAARDLVAAGLEVREHNHPAQALYASLGFVVDGRRPNYYAEEGEDALLMWNDDLPATVAGLPPFLGVNPEPERADY